MMMSSSAVKVIHKDPRGEAKSSETLAGFWPPTSTTSTSRDGTIWHNHPREIMQSMKCNEICEVQ